MSKLRRAQAAAKRLRDKTKAARGDAIKKVTGAGTAYLLGRAQQSGAIENIPSIMGAPKTLTVMVGAGALAWFTSGTLSDAAEGAFDATLYATAWQYGMGQGVQGVSAYQGLHPVAGFDVEDERDVDLLLAEAVSGEGDGYVGEYDDELDAVLDDLDDDD